MAVKKYDFDAWTEDDEQASIVALAETMRVKYMIVGNRFVARFPDGEVAEVPLEVSAEQIEQVQGATPDEQMDALLRIVGDDSLADDLKKRHLAETLSFAESFFAVLQRVSKATLGE